MRTLHAILLATLVLAGAGIGCGSSEVGAGGGASPAAELKPGALAYLEVVSDPGSDQWQQAEDLLRRFPDGAKWIGELRKKVAAEGVDWEQDVEPALGETTAVAVYPGSGEQSAHVVALTNPDDPDKTVALVEELEEGEPGDRTVTRTVGDWVVASDTEAAIDAALETGGASLAADQGFTSAMEKVPADALSRFYADPPEALEALAEADPDAAKAFTMLGADRLDFAAGWFKAKGDGAELAFSAGGEGARLFAAGESYSSALLERVPADAFAFVSFQGSGATRQLEELKASPLYGMGLRRFERELGVKLQELVELADGEIAFYARASLPFPELTLMLESSNPGRARASAEKLLRAYAQREGGEVTEDGDVATAVVDGFPVNLGSVDGLVVFSTSKEAFDELTVSGDKLQDSDRWRSALDAAGVPDEYTSLAYVDLSDAVALLQAYLLFNLESQDFPKERARNLEALRTLVAWGTLDGDVASARAFLEID
jgi:Protein of unknown function (DUF3352)